MAHAWRTKRLRDLEVLFVMATEQEYGPALRERILPLITGVGPVEAAAGTSAVLAALAAGEALPGLVVSLGSAGSRDLDHAEVYQLKSVRYRDMDCTPLGFEKGAVPFLDQPVVIEIAAQIPGIPSASIASGGSIVSGSGYDSLSADMADMESYAVYRACARPGVPMIGLRGISDGRTELARYEDWADYLGMVDEKLALAVDRLFAAVEDGTFSARKPI